MYVTSMSQNKTMRFRKKSHISNASVKNNLKIETIVSDQVWY